MKKMQALLMVLFLLPACLLVAADKGPESKEYKILLKAENFVSFKQGCDLFWELVESVALDHGVKVKKEEKTYTDREIFFADTSDHLFYKRGFMLRFRSELASASSERRDIEMTLKFRASDFESTQVAPVKAASGLGGEISFEEDVVVKASAPSSVFSVSSSIGSVSELPTNLAAFLKFYPGMARAGFSGNAALEKVNKIVVVEKRLRKGELKISGKKAKTVFSVWYKRGENRPFIAEFSFSIKLDPENPAEKIRRIEAVDKFFVELVKRGKLFAELGHTKTGMIYQAR
jgi:hypothetical protein